MLSPSALSTSASDRVLFLFTSKRWNRSVACCSGMAVSGGTCTAPQTADTFAAGAAGVGDAAAAAGAGRGTALGVGEPFAAGDFAAAFAGDAAGLPFAAGLFAAGDLPTGDLTGDRAAG